MHCAADRGQVVERTCRQKSPGAPQASPVRLPVQAGSVPVPIAGQPGPHGTGVACIQDGATEITPSKALTEEIGGQPDPWEAAGVKPAPGSAAPAAAAKERTSRAIISSRPVHEKRFDIPFLQPSRNSLFLTVRAGARREPAPCAFGSDRQRSKRAARDVDRPDR